MRLTEREEDISFSGALALVIIAVVLALTGCATTKETATAEEVTRAGALDGAIAAAKAPLFTLSCPVTGCIIGSLSVGNPGGAAQMAEVVKVAMQPVPSEASQNFRAVLGVLGQVGGWGVIGHYAIAAIGSVTEGFAKGFASNANIATAGFASNTAIAGQIQSPQPNITTTTTLSGYGVIGSGTVTAPVTTTTNPVAKVCGFAGTPPTFICN